MYAYEHAYIYIHVRASLCVCVCIGVSLQVYRSMFVWTAYPQRKCRGNKKHRLSKAGFTQSNHSNKDTHCDAIVMAGMVDTLIPRQWSPSWDFLACAQVKIQSILIVNGDRDLTIHGKHCDCLMRGVGIISIYTLIINILIICTCTISFYHSCLIYIWIWQRIGDFSGWWRIVI